MRQTPSVSTFTRAMFSIAGPGFVVGCLVTSLAASGPGAATVLDRLTATDGPGSVSITLSGDGRLEAHVLDLTGQVPPRLALDFHGVSSRVPAVTWVGTAPVDQVRVAVNQVDPLVTRLVVDLSRPVSYRLERVGPDERDLRIVLSSDPRAAAGVRPSSQVQNRPSAVVPPPGQSSSSEPLRARAVPIGSTVEIDASVVYTNQPFSRSPGVQWGKDIPPFPGLAFSPLGHDFDLEVVRSALEQNRQGQVLSSQRVSTETGVAVELIRSLQIPGPVGPWNTGMGASRPAALRLWVTPDVNSARQVALTLALEMDVLADRDTPRGVQSVEVQRGVTRPPLDDGETLVISGVVVQGQFGRDRASRLRWMPLLNWIFWPAESEDPTGELLIFLTTRIADR